MWNRIKKFINATAIQIFSVWYSLPLMFVALARKLRISKGERMLTYTSANAFTRVFSKFSRYYGLIEFLPKSAEDVTACNLLTDTKDREYAVVIQGPVLNGFTAESIRVYRKILPKAHIIVSTWKGTDGKLADELRELADDVLLNEPPETNGLLNVNYQAKSSYAGMKRASELGIPYAIKIRSDMRMYTPMVFEYMKSLIEAFPLDESVSQRQKERIIATSRGGAVARKYFIRDYFYFGATRDLLNFFDFPPDPVNYSGLTTEDIGLYLHSIKKWVDDNGENLIHVSPEIQLTKSYLQRTTTGNCESTVKRFWEDVSKRFLIVSLSELRLYWDKYNAFRVNFWNMGQTWDGQPKTDEGRDFITPLCLSLIKGHLLYSSNLEEAHRYRIEPFHNLGTFCSGYEHIDEVLKDFPLLRGDGQH
ncbi:MAG: hypothetical protein IJT02_00140 [Synergistaceae bacterium]|nr:hypothetical protein [Synergistaceae bacterium]